MTGLPNSVLDWQELTPKTAPVILLTSISIKPNLNCQSHQACSIYFLRHLLDLLLSYIPYFAISMDPPGCLARADQIVLYELRYNRAPLYPCHYEVLPIGPDFRGT